MGINDEAINDIKTAKDIVDGIVANQELTTEYKHPDPVKHKYISFAKSAVRIAAGVALCYSLFWYAGSLLILAEILGIAEEVV